MVSSDDIDEYSHIPLGSHLAQMVRLALLNAVLICVSLYLWRSRLQEDTFESVHIHTHTPTNTHKFKIIHYVAKGMWTLPSHPHMIVYSKTTGSNMVL